MRVKQVKFHQAVNLPKGGTTGINEKDPGIKGIDTCPEGAIVTLEDGTRYLVPYANIPFLVLKEEEVQTEPKSITGKKSQKTNG